MTDYAGKVHICCGLYRSLKLLRWKRYCEKTNSIKIIYPFTRLIYEHYRIKYGCDIPAKCKIDKGI